MNNETKGPENPAPQSPETLNPDPTNVHAGDAGGSSSGGAAFAPGAGAEGERSELAALRAELEETRSKLDRALRAYAEADNVRKRAEREKDEAAKYAITKFARDIVAVGDNFRRAVETAPADKLAQDPALKAFYEGVEMTERELLATLERHGVRRLDPTGEPFNPRFHQAVMEMETTEVPPGGIVQVFQAGYSIEDRILRPAMVIVAKAPAKDAPASSAATTAPANDGAPYASQAGRVDGATGAQEA